LLKKGWPASWISCPEIPQRDYGVYHFRKVFKVDTLKQTFIVHVSADNRYRLFVNGTAVCSGPARGDLYNWYFETIDIAPYLKEGQNTIAALVWNMGVHAPVAQISNQTAFVLQGNTDAEKAINTNETWKVIKNEAYDPCSMNNGRLLQTYMVIGPGDSVHAARYPWGWEKQTFADTVKWKPAVKIAGPITHGYGTDNLWTLKPRNIPLMFERMQRIPVVRRSTVSGVHDGFLKGTKSLVIPAKQTVSILLDQSFNTVAYPELITSGGKGAVIRMTYAESLFIDTNLLKKDSIKNKELIERSRHAFAKGNRNEIEGKYIKGNYDVFMPDGTGKRTFRPLWFRTYRYVQLDITTADTPLEIDDFYGMATGYPFDVKSSFKSNDSSLQAIWDVGWRTAQLCAGETYFDCPYYEQLQYEGDTRIQSLISLYVTGDDRLMRKAIFDFYHSRVPEGLTQGRYPSNRLQVIPPFSLYWISMLYDYWMHRPDDGLVQSMLIPAMGILDWYEKQIDSKKMMLGPMKWWNFVDWDRSFQSGTPHGATDGNSSVIGFQYAYTLRQAASLFDHYGKKNEAVHYLDLANRLGKATYDSCFDAQRGVLANTPEKKKFSQHASIMAVLSESVPQSDWAPLMKRVISDTGLSQATFYYRFYLMRALKKAGMADMYYAQLKPWREMLENGLTTFAEEPDPTRSDCHAWSSSPNYDFFSTICGINPSKSGFSEVQIEPALGSLTEVNAYMPHPSGVIKVTLKKTSGGGIAGDVELPSSVKGNFIWKGKKLALQGGKQKVELN
jgi:hypothetical protein